MSDRWAKLDAYWKKQDQWMRSLPRDAPEPPPPGWHERVLEVLRITDPSKAAEIERERDFDEPRRMIDKAVLLERQARRLRHSARLCGWKPGTDVEPSARRT